MLKFEQKFHLNEKYGIVLGEGFADFSIVENMQIVGALT
jgi:hypothetical protein